MNHQNRITLNGVIVEVHDRGNSPPSFDLDYKYGMFKQGTGRITVLFAPKTTLIPRFNEPPELKVGKHISLSGHIEDNGENGSTILIANIAQLIPPPKESKS